MLLNVVVQHSALLRKLVLNVEDFYVKTIGWGGGGGGGLKIMFLTMIHGKVGCFHVTDQRQMIA